MSEQQYERGHLPSGSQQQENPPGLQSQMQPEPISSKLPMGGSPNTASVENYKASNRLNGKVALITGGDSGIGRAVAILYAMEGASVAINYLKSEQDDADATRSLVEKAGGKCVLLPGDLAEGDSKCQWLVDQTVDQLGRLDILVNNAAEQWERPSIDELTEEIIDHTMKVNFTSQVLLSKHALKHMGSGSCIINCSSVNHFKGNQALLDYTATKGAIIAYTRSLALQLASKGIRVNAVAPGPIWTPLVAATLDREHIEQFGSSVPLGRPGQPAEVATSFVFLASSDSSYFTGQTLHPNGGVIVGG